MGRYRIAVERGRAGCAGTRANPRNLIGFLDAFKALLWSRLPREPPPGTASRGGPERVIDALRTFRLIIPPMSAVQASFLLLPCLFLHHVLLQQDLIS